MYVHNLDPFLVDFGAFGIRWYALAYIGGFFCAYLIIRWLARRKLTQLSEAQASDFVFAIALGTIIGGRLGYCLFYSPELFLEFSSSPPFWGALAINKGGMASHGGIIGIIVAAHLFARKHGLSTLHLMDLTALGTIGIFFGRIANFINGELVGRIASPSFRWGVKFPQDILLWPSQEPERLLSLSPVVNTLGIPDSRWQQLVQQLPQSYAGVDHVLWRVIEGIQEGNELLRAQIAPLLSARHPSQLYEAFLEGLFLLIALALLWGKPRKPGVISGYFITLYAVVRIIGEQFRLPDAHIGYQWLGLTRGQWLSVAMLAVGIVGLVSWSRRSAAPIGGWLRKGASKNS